MSITSIQKEIVADFSFLENLEDKYTYIIELGKSLPNFPKEYQQDAFLVRGCQSRVWLVGQLDSQSNYVEYFTDSDSALVKGLAALIVKVLSKQPPSEIVQADLFFIEKIGLKQMLTLNRANGLSSFLRKSQVIAKDFLEKL